jgi:cytochrome c oxidase subunit 6b
MWLKDFPTLVVFVHVPLALTHSLRSLCIIFHSPSCRCKAQQGEDAEECEKYAKYYRSLCPTEWVTKWNEEREAGTWPGRY